MKPVAAAIRIWSPSNFTRACSPATTGWRSTTASISASAASTASAAFFSTAVRKHWQIENTAHWVLDVAFREDLCRVRVQHAAENFARIRRVALTILKQDKTAKVGIQGRRLKAAWDRRYLLRLLRV